jgi:hypothetical protein
MSNATIVAATPVWTGDWVWGLLMIAVSLAIHSVGLGLIALALARLFGRIQHRLAGTLRSLPLFATVIGFASLLLATLHGIEAMLWALCYVALGAVSDTHEAVYFSLAMITTSGADVAMLGPHWKLMGAFEAVGGMLVFGLSTAFLFALVRRAWPPDPGERRPVD